MEEKEFFDLINNCIRFTSDEYTNIIFYYYDTKLIRQKKLSKIENVEIKLDLTNIDNDKILFEQDTKNKYFWVDYREIWSKFETKYQHNTLSAKEIIEVMLNNHTNLTEYTPHLWFSDKDYALNNHTNLTEYTPIGVKIIFTQLLNNHTNLTEHTHFINKNTSIHKLNNHTNLRGYTTNISDISDCSLLNNYTNLKEY